MFRPIYLAIAFVILFGLCYWVRQTGKPYSVLLLAIHKLTGVGIAVYLSVVAVRMHKAAPLEKGQLATLGVSAVLFVALVATGGMISTEKEMPVFVQQIHKIVPYLTALVTAGALYLLQ